ncbi:MAG: OmpH family outer membrane protein [bacterium]
MRVLRQRIRQDPRKAGLVAVGAAVVVIAAIAAVVLAGGSGVPVFGQSFTIGFVDLQRALDAHPRKAASERALQEFFQAKQREFNQRVKGLTAEQRQLLDRQLQQQVIEKRQELLGGLDKELRTAVEEVARTQGISIVLERAVVLFGGVELTDPVIKKVTGK